MAIGIAVDANATTVTEPSKRCMPPAAAEAARAETADMCSADVCGANVSTSVRPTTMPTSAATSGRRIG
jgi:hypothetical protein